MIAFILSRYERQVHRILEITPGLLTWSLLLSPIWLGVLFPSAIVYLLTFLTVYWAYLAAKYSIGTVLGYFRYQSELKEDWWANVREMDFSQLPEKETLPESLEAVRHFLLIPAYNEPYGVLKESIDSIFGQTFPANQLFLVYTIEQKYSERVIADIYKAMEGREKELAALNIFVHPSGIPGEAVGAGAANRTWGAKHAVDELNKSGVLIKNYIFSTIDADHILHPQYISRLTHLYLSTAKRNNHFYSTAVHLFDNNYWEVPAIMRIEATSITLGGLSDWIVSDMAIKDTFSAYSASLQTLIDADYWDVAIGIDDTVFYWRAFFVRNGDFKGIPHFIPYSADAVEGTTYWNSYKSLYRQLLRWGWGVVVFPLSMKGFMTNKLIPIRYKLMWTLEQFKKKVLLVSIVFLITFGFSIVTFVNHDVKQTNFAYNLPYITSFILTCTLIFLIPGTAIRFKMSKPIPGNWPLWKKTIAFFEGPMVIINLLTFSFFPFVEAQTRMLLGKKMKDLYYTPKIR